MHSTHPDWDDPMARVGALIATMVVAALLIISTSSRSPAVVAAPQTRLQPLIVITATPALPTARPPEPAAQPTPEPVIVVQYVEVPVPVYVPATIDPPPAARPVETHYQEVAVPEGGVQVSIAPAGEKPIVSSIHTTGIDQPRPARLNRGESSGQVTP